MTIIDKTILELLFEGTKDATNDSDGVDPISMWMAAFQTRASRADSFTTKISSSVTCTAQAVV